MPIFLITLAATIYLRLIDKYTLKSTKSIKERCPHHLIEIVNSQECVLLFLFSYLFNIAVAFKILLV